MREIKFRVWNLVNQEFDYFNSTEGNCYLITLDGLVKDGNGNPYDEQHVLQQFTGLKDSQGREIYEGDILEYDYRDGYAVVKYDEEDGSYYLDGENLNWLDVFSDKRKWYKCEIKGNIYENSELLK